MSRASSGLRRLLLGGFAALLIFTTVAAAPFEATGLVEPDWEATLASTVLGRVASIAVEEGEQIAKGAPLLFLERTFEELDADRRRVVAESTVELVLAQAKAELLRSEFEGTRSIYEKSGSISKEEFERARLDMQLAEAELAQLKQREKIEELEWKLAQEQVDRREIRAPQAGTVVEIVPSAGEVCEPRQPLARMVDATTVKITLEVDALGTGEVVSGALVPVTIDAPGGVIEATGRVDFVSPVVDRASGLRRIRIRINNETGRILPGLTARVRFP